MPRDALVHSNPKYYYVVLIVSLKKQPYFTHFLKINYNFVLRFDVGIVFIFSKYLYLLELYTAIMTDEKIIRSGICLKTSRR